MEVFRDLAHAAEETYTGEPIYDEELEEGPECWPEKEFILAALQGGHPNFSNPLPPEICTSERSENSDNLSHTQVIQDMNIHSPLQNMKPSQLEVRINNGLRPYCPALDGFQHVCKQACQSMTMRTEEEPATSLVNKPDRVVEYGDRAKFVEYKGEKTQGVKEESSIVPTNMSELLGNDLCGDSPIAANSAGLEQNSSHLIKKNMLILELVTDVEFYI